MGYSRRARVGAEITREVSDILRTQMKDPRLAELVSVVRTEVTGDLRIARVYVSVLGDQQQRAETKKMMDGAAGFFRSGVGSRLKMRHIPEIQFVMDDSIEYSVHISKLIDSIRKDEAGDGQGE